MKRPSFVLALFAVVAFFAAVNVQGDETPGPTEAQTPVIRVAMYADKGVGPGGYKNFPPIFDSDPRFDLTMVTGQQIRDGILDQFDIFLLPGGMSTVEAASM